MFPAAFSPHLHNHYAARHTNFYWIYKENIYFHILGYL